MSNQLTGNAQPSSWAKFAQTAKEWKEVVGLVVLAIGSGYAATQFFARNEDIELLKKQISDLEQRFQVKFQSQEADYIKMIKDSKCLFMTNIRILSYSSAEQSIQLEITEVIKRKTLLSEMPKKKQVRPEENEMLDFSLKDLQMKKIKCIKRGLSLKLDLVVENAQVNLKFFTSTI